MDDQDSTKLPLHYNIKNVLYSIIKKCPVIIGEVGENFIRVIKAIKEKLNKIFELQKKSELQY